MKRYDKITPEGTTDLLFEQCEARAEVCSKLSKIYKYRGFNEVITPTIEFYDVFNSSSAYFLQDTMYKLIDNKGRLIVLRPDCTIPIARLVSTKLKDAKFPIRLFYNQNVYRTFPDMRGRSNEINQIGVELVGSNTKKSDLEIIELAANSLKNTAGDSFRIELCHIGFFKLIMESLKADNDVKENIRLLIEQKNYAALNDLLSQYKDQKAAVALINLPRLFGGEEIFDEAARLFGENDATEILNYIRSIYSDLKHLGLEGKVIVDLGLVNNAEYYTGVIFRGYLNGIGEPVLSGGRYDNLVGDFGLDLPATGFGINTDLISRFLLEQKNEIYNFTSDVLIHCDDDFIVNALKYAEKLNSANIKCEISSQKSIELSIEYAKEKNIKQVHIVAEDIEIINTDVFCNKK